MTWMDKQGKKKEEKIVVFRILGKIKRMIEKRDLI